MHQPTFAGFFRTAARDEVPCSPPRIALASLCAELEHNPENRGEVYAKLDLEYTKVATRLSAKLTSQVTQMN